VTPEFKIFIPVNMNPRPEITIPKFFMFFFLGMNLVIRPITSMGKARFVSLKEINWAVTVVPILAPYIMPTAWESLIRPELTSPTVMAVTAALL